MKIMKKTVFVTMIILLLFCGVSADNDEIYRAADGIEVEIGNFSFEDFAKSLAQGEGMPVQSIGKSLVNFLLGEVKTAMGMLGTAVAVAILSGAVSGMCFGKDAEGITFFICITLASGMAVTGFYAIGEMAEKTVRNISVFMSAAVPSMAALGVASGNTAAFMTAAPVMLSGTLNSYIVSYIVIPAMYTALAMSIVSNIGEKKYLDKFSKLVMKTALWVVCGAETIYCAITGISSFAAGAIGKVAGKAVKFTVSSAIPVVGSILSDATDALASSAAVIKNTAGAAGMVLIILLFAAPVLKCAAMLFAYRLCAAVIQPVCDKRITALFSDIGEVLASLTGILIAMGVAGVISLGILAGGIK